MRLIFGFGAFGLGGGGFPDGRAISRLLTICGVVMMKITRSTKTRSSNGVMFNSFIVPWPRLVVFLTLMAGRIRRGPCQTGQGHAVGNWWAVAGSHFWF